MGYELTRFQGEVDEELICPICSGVLEEPVQVRDSFFLLITLLPMTCNLILPTYGFALCTLHSVAFIFIKIIRFIYRLLFVNMRFVAHALLSGCHDSQPVPLTEMP